MANQTNLFTAAVGNVTSTVATRSRTNQPGAIVITSTIGATPTVTVNIQGSADGTAYYNIPYALVATPTTFVLTALTITTAVTTTYLLQTDQPWQYCRLVTTANTNVTLTADAWL
jgi:hypothetical protein